MTIDNNNQKCYTLNMMDTTISFITKIKMFFKQLLFFIPTRLPIGMLEFDEWSADILENTIGAPNNDSTKFALATAIIHLESVSKVEFNLIFFKVTIPTSAYKSKRYFAQMLLKGAANQVAVGIMNELKAKQQAEAKATTVEAPKQ